MDREEIEGFQKHLPDLFRTNLSNLADEVEPSLLGHQQTFEVVDLPGVAGSLKPDLYVKSRGRTDFVVECKFYQDPMEDLHIGTVAEVNFMRDTFEKVSGKLIEGIILTNASVPTRLVDDAAELNIDIINIGRKDSSLRPRERTSPEALLKQLETQYRSEFSSPDPDDLISSLSLDDQGTSIDDLDRHRNEQTEALFKAILNNLTKEIGS